MAIGARVQGHAAVDGAINSQELSPITRAAAFFRIGQFALRAAAQFADSLASSANSWLSSWASNQIPSHREQRSTATPSKFELRQCGGLAFRTIHGDQRLNFLEDVPRTLKESPNQFKQSRAGVLNKTPLAPPKNSEHSPLSIINSPLIILRFAILKHRQ